jgi:hypothetical protein
VVQPLAEAVESLDRYGQLSAIEGFEYLGDSTAGPALMNLRGSEHDTVREWSAWALAELSVRAAVPMLRSACRRQRASGNGPDWTEAVAIRHALMVVGAQQEVMPPFTASLRTTAGSIQRAWPSARLADVINDLADHNQAVLYFRLWAILDRGTFWNGHERPDEPIDHHTSRGSRLWRTRETWHSSRRPSWCSETSTRPRCAGPTIDKISFTGLAGRTTRYCPAPSRPRQTWILRLMRWRAVRLSISHVLGRGVWFEFRTWFVWYDNEADDAADAGVISGLADP